jgi:hypothetical protein
VNASTYYNGPPMPPITMEAILGTARAMEKLKTAPREMEIREVPAGLLPPGQWWAQVPESLAGRPMVITSDLARFKALLAGKP